MFIRFTKVRTGHTNVYPIYEDADGALLVGTTRGLFRFHNGRFAPVKSAENFYVQAIGKDPAGRIVVSDYSNLYVREENRFVPFLKGQIPVLDVSDTVYAIHTDRENQLWIGGKGLTRFSDGAATTFTTADGLAGNDVKVIIEARGGGLWIGTYGGLSLFKDGNFTSWTEQDGLPSRTIRALYQDADGALWIGSYDGGLARFMDRKFTRYNISVGLYNDGAFQILEDDSRNFWVSSNHGIYRVNKDQLNEFAEGKRKTISSTVYGKSDGMLNVECNGGRSPGGVKTRDGRLWFPTQDGVAMIDPREVKVNPQPPPVVIESVKIDNTVLGFDEEKSKIQIEASQQNFEITYTALSFINSENLRFKYKLEGA
jgi:ligand-binding sensor domain-containing protein